MTRILAAMIFAIFALLPAYAATPAQTFLTLDSQPGDYVGQGMIQTFTAADGTFNVQGSSANISVFFNTPDSGRSFTLGFCTLAWLLSGQEILGQISAPSVGTIWIGRGTAAF
jgi:hypothetical protein